MKKALCVLAPLTLGAALLVGVRGRPARAADPDPCAAAPTTAPGVLEGWLRAECYKRPALGYVRDKHEKRKTGPERATAPHGRVTVYYSPQVYAWLKSGRRGAVPDGALMVKEMFGWDSGEYSGRAAMLKQASGSFAGWYFYPGEFLAAGCIGCHASALSELTFADLSHIDGTEAPPQISGPPSALALASHPGSVRRDQPPRPPLLTLSADELSVPPPPALGLHLRDNIDFVHQFPWPALSGVPFGPQSVLPLPSWRQARGLVPGPGGPPLFLPSTNCYGCHDAQVPDRSASMVLPAERSSQFLNLSPYAEWSASLMGLSGRDPVFHAQLESEKALRPELAVGIDDTCYRCHGAAGQRQMHLDLGQPFPHGAVYAEGSHPLARYGALARDGVTCTVCHHIAESGLGTPASYNGQFAVGRPDEVFGPYKDGVKAQPMKQALGMTPAGSDHLRRSALCGSCHTVVLPQVPAGYRGDAFSDPRLGQEHEQNTYLEWRNSSYQDEQSPGPAARSCQSCHMPALFGTTEQGLVPLASKIANIEEFLPGVPSSQPATEITLAPRVPYARHTLTGINLFVMRMFSQFAGVLGIARRDPLAGEPAFLSSLNLAQREALALAQRATARVELSSAPRIVTRGGQSTLVTTVRVTNLAGHKFPSGVGFRRAFLELVVQDASGAVVWASGRTSPQGVLLGPDGQPLPSEFTQDPAVLQRHHERITKAEQVQIYEERIVDDSGRLTTSFLSGFKRVKDTRLLPAGWSVRQPGTEFMQPLSPGGKMPFADGRCFDEVTYAIPVGNLSGPQPGPLTVQATLYYQSIPPYYLRDRFAVAQGPETKRLYLLASGLDATGAIKDWKLLIGTTGKIALSGPQ